MGSGDGAQPQRRRRRRRRRRSGEEPSPGGDGGEKVSGSQSPSRSERRHRKHRHRHRSSSERHRRRRRGEERRSSPSEKEPGRKRRRDDGPPHFECEVGEVLGVTGRYVVRDTLGDGLSGRVLECTDSKTGGFVAVKVYRDAARQRRHFEREIQTLLALMKQDAAKYQQHVVNMLDQFAHEGHFCIAFEALDVSLREFLSQSGSRGLFLKDVREAAKQLLEAFKFLHSAQIAHGDLKCTNVMLRDGNFDLAPHPRQPAPEQAPVPKNLQLVLIDFGLATDMQKSVDRNNGVRVGARHIRAPEVVLGLQWDCIIDLWSLGCLLVSLYTGDRIFKVHSEMEHLMTIEQMTDQRIPSHMGQAVSERIRAKGVRFDQLGKLEWTEEDAERVREVPTLKEFVLPRHQSLLRLLQGLMQVDPNTRISAEDGLNMPFITDEGLVE